jgi:hypothetical protein
LLSSKDKPKRSSTKQIKDLIKKSTNLTETTISTEELMHLAHLEGNRVSQGEEVEVSTRAVEVVHQALVVACLAAAEADAVSQKHKEAKVEEASSAGDLQSEWQTRVS